VDLGTIMLAPCGTLELKAFAEDGKALSFYEVRCREKRYRCKTSNLFEGLPLGSINLRIKKEGYHAETLDLFLEPGETYHAQVVLISEEKPRMEQGGDMGRAGSPVIAGRVLDEATGESILSYDLRLYRDDPDGGRVEVLRKAVKDPGGAFTLLLEKGGHYSLSVRTSRHRPEVIDDLEVPDGGGCTELRVVMNPGRSVSGRVVEDLSGRPVEGALVVTDAHGYPIRLEQGCPEYVVHAETDASGRFTLTGLSGDRQRIAALHPDFAQGFVGIEPGGSEIEIRLKKGYRISGRVLDDDGLIQSGIMITVTGSGIAVPCAVFTDRDGRYLTDPVLPGLVQLRASVPPEGKKGFYPFNPRYTVIVIIDRDVEADFGFPRFPKE
jgi:hypothetical protein